MERGDFSKRQREHYFYEDGGHERKRTRQGDREVEGMSSDHRIKRRTDAVPPNIKVLPRVLFISDSLLNILAHDKPMQNAAYKAGWEMRLRRGATASDGLNLMRAAEATMTLIEFDHIVISVGSNDMSNMARSTGDGKLQREEKMLHSLREAAWVSRRHENLVWVLEPPPRQDVTEELRAEMIRKIKREMDEIPRVKVLPFTRMSAQEFHKHTTDGVHVKKEAAQQIIMDIIARMGIEPTLLDTSEVGLLERGNNKMCMKCGYEDYRKTHRCTDHKECERCGRIGHHQEACPSNTHMCYECGRRGHSVAKCFRK
jgi:hypothetical protein